MFFACVHLVHGPDYNQIYRGSGVSADWTRRLGAQRVLAAYGSIAASKPQQQHRSPDLPAAATHGEGIGEGGIE
jgi:hypothetical protein